ncbi:integrase [Lottiidibacillus patelloidae]|uniref:Integrase n=2 Tax=Lottiidibacillus patelloidae TaxID=2670334 RepID=A0A263BXB5_9BACI|nr:integrase [Lottiidibacillus patelloidae]
MRQGEVLGLRWQDIDFDIRTLSVTQTLSHDGKTLNRGAKTKASIRTIALPKETVDKLKHHRKLVEDEKKKAGTIYNDNDLVVCTEIGTPCHPRNILRTMYTVIKKVGLQRIRFHDLRHTHATLLLKQGTHPKIVSERLGHADTRITLDRYSHLLPNMQREVADSFGDMLFGSEYKSKQDVIKEWESILYHVTKA